MCMCGYGCGGLGVCGYECMGGMGFGGMDVCVINRNLPSRFPF